MREETRTPDKLAALIRLAEELAAAEKRQQRRAEEGREPTPQEQMEARVRALHNLAEKKKKERRQRQRRVRGR